MGFQGLNPSELTSSINQMNGAYTKLYDGINSNSTKYVGELSGVWGNGKAVEFGADFQTTVNQLLNSVTKVFESVNSAMNSAGMAWNEANKSSRFGSVSFSAQSGQVSAGSIKDNIGGAEGMDPEAVATSTGNFCNNTLTEASAALKAAKSAVSGAQAFLGGSQQANLISSLDSIAQSITGAVDKISSEIEKVTDRNVEVNAQTTQEVASAFNS